LVPRAPRGGLPRQIVSHRAFDGKETPIVVGDDEEELPRRLGVRRGRFSHDSEGRHGHADAPVGNGHTGPVTLLARRLPGVGQILQEKLDRPVSDLRRSHGRRQKVAQTVHVVFQLRFLAS
jgi:hypothetical protein